MQLGRRYDAVSPARGLRAGGALKDRSNSVD
jgi:hypothetical protein